MTNTLKFLSGKKTYIVAGLGACVFVAQTLGYLDVDTANQLYTIFGITGTVTMRSAIK